MCDAILFFGVYNEELVVLKICYTICSEFESLVLCWLIFRSTDTLGVINIDAHLDVRPKKDNLVHSGSPFRLLLEDGSQIVN
jgi:hypothetical protein